MNGYKIQTMANDCMDSGGLSAAYVFLQWR